jgi:hypothetical protein
MLGQTHSMNCGPATLMLLRPVRVLSRSLLFTALFFSTSTAGADNLDVFFTPTSQHIEVEQLQWPVLVQGVTVTTVDDVQHLYNLLSATPITAQEVESWAFLARARITKGPSLAPPLPAANVAHTTALDWPLIDVDGNNYRQY